MEAERREVNPLDELNNRMLAFHESLGTPYDPQVIQGAFADVEVSVTDAARQGLRGAVETYEALRELSTAVAEVATVNGDQSTATVFTARATSFEATRTLMSDASKPKEATPAPAAAEAEPTRKRRRSRGSNTTKQPVGSRK